MKFEFDTSVGTVGWTDTVGDKICYTIGQRQKLIFNPIIVFLRESANHLVEQTAEMMLSVHHKLLKEMFLKSFILFGSLINHMSIFYANSRNQPKQHIDLKEWTDC